MVEFRKMLDSSNITYKMRDKLIITNVNDDIDLRKLKTIPAGIVFKNKGNIDLSNLKTLPECMIFKNKGSVYLRNLKTLPEGIVFKNDGSVDLESLTTLPEGIDFKNKGWLDLSNLKTLPEGTVFKNNCWLDLSGLENLPEGTVFENDGEVDLRSLKNIPDNIIFKNEGSVDLRRLKTLPEDIRFENKGPVDLYGLNNQHIIYQGKKVLIRQIDNRTMIISSSKVKDDYIIHLVKYFEGGAIEKLEKCYIAQKGEYFAHGKTIQQAIKDVTFKYLQENIDVTELVNSIKESQVVTSQDYRLLTGACEAGVKKFKKENGITSDSISLQDMLHLTKDSYGGEKVQQLFKK